MAITSYYQPTGNSRRYITSTEIAIIREIPLIFTALWADSADDTLMIYIYILYEKKKTKKKNKKKNRIWHFKLENLQSGEFAWNFKTCFLWKIRFFLICRLLKIEHRVLSVNFQRCGSNQSISIHYTPIYKCDGRGVQTATEFSCF